MDNDISFLIPPEKPTAEPANGLPRKPTERPTEKSAERSAKGPAGRPDAETSAIRERMRSTLLKYFGYPSFRPNQADVIEHVLSGQDVFVLMPTGGGKSICYQIPALLSEGTAIVVSPLISLMKDQVDNLLACGVPAACLNSTLSEREFYDVRSRFLDGRLKVLYVAPERLMMRSMISLLKRASISLFAIDEAHCISEWGHDFRPEYRKLSELRTDFPNVPIIALTATATERVRSDIVRTLGLRQPFISISSFNRPNLSYRIVEKKDAFEQIVSYIRKKRNQSGIIYCQSRDAVERLSQKLSRLGFSCAPYHAGLSDDVRARNQEKFIKDDVSIIVATVAFGMGIDKPDVRYVIHYDLPKNPESYYQETGRGGRDGLECDCILFFSRGDWHKIKFFIDQKRNKKERDIAFQQLSTIIAYCESTECRRNFLLRYFGEEMAEPCGKCDACLNPRQKTDGTENARLLIECVRQTGQKFGMGHVVDVLWGARTQKVKTCRHDRLDIHGVGKALSKDRWKQIGGELVQAGILSISGDRYPIVKLNEKSRQVLAGNMRVTLTMPGAGQTLTSPGTGGIGMTDVPDAESFADEDIFDPADDSCDIETADGEEIGMLSETADILSTSGNGFSGPEGIHSGTADVSTETDTDHFAEDRAGTARPDGNSFSRPLKKETADVSYRKTKGVFDPILFERLRRLRKEIANSKNLPPYIIFADTSLRQMASDRPVTEEDFMAVSGVGEHKFEKYGRLFIDEIADYENADPNTETGDRRMAAVADEKTDAPLSGANDGAGLSETASLYAQGLSVSEIAEVRSVSAAAVVKDIERLIRTQKIDNADRLVSAAKQESIEKAIRLMTIDFIDSLHLSAVSEKTGLDCTEDEIRLMRALISERLKRQK